MQQYFRQVSDVTGESQCASALAFGEAKHMLARAVALTKPSIREAFDLVFALLVRRQRQQCCHKQQSMILATTFVTTAFCTRPTAAHDQHMSL